VVIVDFVLVWGNASAFEGKCVLEVDGYIYLSNNCNVERWDGGFSIGAGNGTRSRYFAYLTIDPTGATARGFWNGVQAEGHAGEDIGVLVPDRGCWKNSRARICASK
jgi:hypothetical protein